MSDLLAARSQMAMSLGFHIIFAVIGIGMPVLMVVAEHRWHRTGDPVYLALAHRWANGTAILFAVGAVSGTVLAFELGLLWPVFMRESGAAIGLLFSLEGFAFFAEAIFLGVYLYGWRRVSHRAHMVAGVLVAMSGTASAVFVVTVNAWMNTPVGEMATSRTSTPFRPCKPLRRRRRCSTWYSPPLLRRVSWSLPSMPSFCCEHRAIDSTASPWPSR
jgi:cytochrome d ubiquinol oxidase subunit I